MVRPYRTGSGEGLHEAATSLEGEATADPLGVARMQVALGVALMNLGHREEAVRYSHGPGARWWPGSAGSTPTP